VWTPPRSPPTSRRSVHLSVPFVRRRPLTVRPTVLVETLLLFTTGLSLSDHLDPLSPPAHISIPLAHHHHSSRRRVYLLGRDVLPRLPPTPAVRSTVSVWISSRPPPTSRRSVHLSVPFVRRRPLTVRPTVLVETLLLFTTGLSLSDHLDPLSPPAHIPIPLAHHHHSSRRRVYLLGRDVLPRLPPTPAVRSTVSVWISSRSPPISRRSAHLSFPFAYYQPPAPTEKPSPRRYFGA
jgi:hypothetical protein